MVYKSKSKAVRRGTILSKVVSLEKRLSKNKAEVKIHDVILDSGGSSITGGGWNAFFLSDIAQGTSAGQRIGDKIRILKVEVRGLVNAVGMDLFLFRNKSGAPMDTSMFSSMTNCGAFLKPNAFQVYHYELVGGKNNAPTFVISKSFGTGLVNSYNTVDATSLQTNRLIFLVKNPFAGLGLVNATARVYYTDA